jgi:hypothetical protein
MSKGDCASRAPARRLASMLRVVAVLLGLALAAPAPAVQINPGQLRVVRAGRGLINLDSGQASFRVVGWEIIPPSTSNGLDPGTEPVTIAIGDQERFLVPAGQMKVLRKGKRFLYKAKTDRGIQLLKLAWTPAGTLKMTLKISGVDLSRLVLSDAPVCMSMAVIIGDDDGFSGVQFDRPKPFPSRLLTIPGFCEPQDWPWA